MTRTRYGSQTRAELVASLPDRDPPPSSDFCPVEDCPDPPTRGGLGLCWGHAFMDGLVRERMNDQWNENERASWAW